MSLFLDPAADPLAVEEDLLADPIEKLVEIDVVGLDGPVELTHGEFSIGDHLQDPLDCLEVLRGHF